MNNEITDKIEQYLNNEMQPQERNDFEWQLQNDEVLKNNFNLYNSINNTMKANEVSDGENKLAATLKQLNREYFLQGSKVTQGNFKKWLAAAAAVLILVFGTVYFLSDKSISAEKLYAVYAEHAAINIQLRGNTSDSFAGIAADKFNTKQYYEALPLLQEYLKQQPGDIQMEFAEGICQLELDNYNKAENIFVAIANGTSGYVEPAKWYLALTALKQKHISECRIRLKAIPQTSSYYTRADALLKKLPD